MPTTVMSRRSARKVLLATLLPLALGLTLALAGCNGNTSTCVNGTCHLTVTITHTGGAESASVQNQTVTVSNLTQDSATVQINGDTKTIQSGQSANVGGVYVAVDSVSGDQVKLTLQGVQGGGTPRRTATCVPGNRRFC